MQFGYSAKKDAFYFLDEEAAYRESGYWQDDIVPVTDEVWCEFVGQPPAGKKRGAGKDGLPAWVDIPQSQELKKEVHMAAKQALMEKADTEIRLLNVVQDVYGLNEEEKNKLNAWKNHLAEVYRLNVNVQEKIDWPAAPENL